MGDTRGRIRLLLSAACCSLIMTLGSCQDPSDIGKSIWTMKNVWAPVGHSAISASNVAYTSVAVAPDGTPYVAFEDGAHGAAASVMKFNGSWTYVGSPGFSGVTAQSTTLAFDSNGILYVAFVDASATKAAVSVMKYTGTGTTGWQFVGNADLSGSATNDVWQVCIAIDPSGTPHVAYTDPVTTMATVMKYSPGTNTWGPVGPAGGFSGAGASNVSLAFDKAGTPYVAYTDGSWGNQETAMTFNGSTWVLMGTQGFSGSSVAYVSIVLDASGVPYVGYGDATAPGIVASVMKYSGGAWSYVGPRGLSSGVVLGVSLALSPTGNPSIAYQDGTDGSATVMEFSGGNWSPIGRTGFSGGGSQFTSLAIDSNGTPYVAYQDGAHGGYATVMRFQ